MVESRSVGFAEVLRVGEFRALWSAETISVLGDQLARVALALLVFDRTSSAVLTALTYALTFVPAFLGGFLLAGLADRYPRRQVIIATDLVRGGLALAMAIPGLPLGVLWALVALLTFASGPFKAAQLALLPQVMEGDRYTTGLALRQISTQIAQVAGFAVGGVLVAAVTPQGALAVNAGTFLLSALLVAVAVRPRPAAAKTRGEAPGANTAPLGRLAPVFVLVGLAGLYVVPEGLAAPYAEALGAASFTVGFLMAADPVGSVLGAWLAAKVRVEPTLNSVFWPAALAGLPLVLCAVAPNMVVSAFLWALSGALSTIYLIRLQAHVVRVVPDHRRGTVMGRISTCLYTSQGVAILGGGVLSEATSPFIAVAVCGALGVLLVLVTAVVWGRARPGGQVSLSRTATSRRRHGPDDPGTGEEAGAGSPSGTGATPV